MFVPDPITPPIDEPCGLTGLPAEYISPPQSLMDTGNEDRLIQILRDAARGQDSIEILTRSTVAFFAMQHAAVLLQFLSNSPITLAKQLAQAAVANTLLAPALADLSVTGRGAFARFRRLAPRKSQLLDKVLMLLQGWPEATQDNVLVSVREALDRAYHVARALRGQETRPPGWIAVSGEDDPPHRPVNVPGPLFYPQFDLTVTVRGIPVGTRYMIASDFIPPPPPAIVQPLPTSGGIDQDRPLPADRRPTMPEGEVFIYIHGHSSRLEEALDLAPRLIAAGKERGKSYIVIAMDLPCNGYSTMFDHTNIAPSEASAYPTGYPILDFIEEFIIAFVEELDRQLNIKTRIAAVIGGSLGGNMCLRLGRRANSTGWLTNIAAWSPASVGETWATATLNPLDPNFDIVKHEGVRISRDRMNEDAPVGVPPVDSPPEIEAPERRHQYFAQVFDGYQGQPAQAPYWYRDGWQPCKQFYMDMARRDRREIYNAWFRRWHWRVAHEQLIFSHRDPDTPGTPPRYALIRANMLLGSGGEDNPLGLRTWDNTRDIAKLMINTPGRALFLLNTGHSIHNERPQLLAREITDFLLTKGKEKEKEKEGKDGKDKEKEASKDRKDNKETAKEKDNPKENLKEKDQDSTGPAVDRLVNGPVALLPPLSRRAESNGKFLATGQAFIRPEERPAVGERMLQQSDQG